MNDITKCEGNNCPQKESCYRFLAKPDRLQSYSAFDEIRTPEKCEYYWEEDNGRTTNRTIVAKII